MSTEKEIRIFHDKSFDNVSFDDQLKYLGMAALYLGIASLAHDGNNKQLAEQMMIEASKLAHPYDCKYFNALYGAVRIDMAWEEDITSNEYHYHRLFKQYAEEILADCEVVNTTVDERNKPDVWVEIKGEKVPVEMKVGIFDKKALSQLERYISNFHANSGIAVGKELATELPKNVSSVPTFVLDALKERDTHHVSLGEILYGEDSTDE